MLLSKQVLQVIERLEKYGYEAYAVGGCVRDSLLGKTPADWDVCTSALPQEVCDVFADAQCIPTGLQHGTVTVLVEAVPIEITTYRREEGYDDHRHPDRVIFVNSLEEDLSRRDFTVNAMAYHPDRGLADPFGGRDDLDVGILRCVGNAEQRFEEDALRILRCLRFAACYGFAVEEATARAAHAKADGLRSVAGERIRAELDRLLTGKAVGSVLRDFRAVLFRVIPELAATDGFEQHSRYHDRDVFEHTVESVAKAECNRTVRLALLLHDVGKPQCFSRDADGQGHFLGHALISESIANDVLYRLRYDRQTVERVCLLIRYHDTVVLPTETNVKRWLNRFGEDYLRQLLSVKAGDCMGHAPILYEERLNELKEIATVIDRVVQQRQCFSLKDLKVNGQDVLSLGVSGKAVGEALQWALEAVMDGTLDNDREILMDALRKRT